MYLEILCKIVGGLGIFLYGMENMSGGMQKLAGKRLKKILAVLTTNRVVAVLMGLFVTMLVQSSSVSTVMTIGFVNASLLTLKQGLGVILGANIGTTITGWILVLNIGKYGLPIAGAAAIAYVFLKGDKARTRALTIMGLGMIFLGLELMSNGLKPVRSMPEFIRLFHMFSADTYFGVVKTACVGALITGIVQSSSATLGITITLALQGLIDYNTAVALVLGENVGTTITAILATLNANANAKRAAYAHTIINITGVLWATTIFPFYIKFLGNFADPNVNMTMAIATAHTMFNVINVIMFTPFVGVLAKFLCFLVKDDKGISTKVTQLDMLMVGTPSVVVGQTKKEVLQMGSNIKEMIFTIEEVFAKKQDITEEQVGKLQAIEDKLDIYQQEITDINFQILNKELDENMKEETRLNLEVCDEYETISDYLVRIAKTLRKLHDNEIVLSEEKIKKLSYMNDAVNTLFKNVNTAYETKDKEMFIKAIVLANHITDKFRETRTYHLENTAKVEGSAMFSTSYMDILNHYRRIRDHIFNIIEVYTR